MKKLTTIPAIRGLKYILAPVGRWIIDPHPILVISIVTSVLAHYGILQLFSDASRMRLIESAKHLRSGFSLVFPIMIITGICLFATRRLMFYGGATLEQHQDSEIDDRWPQQKISYLQGITWFIVGIGYAYLRVANMLVDIVKGVCIGITETVKFILVTLPVAITEALVATLKFFHSSKSLIATLYTMIVMLASVWFAMHYPHRLNVVTVFRVIIPIVIIVSSWQMYNALGKLGKDRAKHS